MSFHVAPLEICLTDWLNSTISIVRQSFAVPFVETVHLSLFLWFVEYIGFFPIDSSKLAESKNCKIVIFVYCFLYCILYDLFPFFFFTFDLLDVIKNHHEMTNSIQVPFQFYLTFCHCPFHCVIKNLRITIFTYNSSSSSSNNDILSQLFPAGNRKNHHRQQQQFQRNERERTKNVENFLHNFQSKLNFHSLSNSIHSISALKDKYRIKNTRIPSQYNFQLRTSKSPSFRLLATILFTYSYRDWQINNSKRENTREKREFSFRRPIKIHHFENNAFPQRIDTWLSRYLLSLGTQVSKRETSILNLAAGGRRMESLFLSLFETRLLLHLSAPVLDLCSTFHRSRRRSSVTRLLPPLLRPSPYASVS